MPSTSRTHLKRLSFIVFISLTILGLDKHSHLFPHYLDHRHDFYFFGKEIYFFFLFHPEPLEVIMSRPFVLVS